MVSAKGLTYLAVLGVVWGIPYLFIGIAVQELSPEFIVLARVGISAIALLPFALARHELRSTLRRYWPVIVAYATVQISLPWYFLNLAGAQLPSSTVGLLLAAVPLVGVVVGLLIGRNDQLRWPNWLGLGLGVLGVAALVGLDVDPARLGATPLLLVPIIGFAVGPAILARYAKEAPTFGLNTWALLVVAITYLVFTAISGGWPTAAPRPETIGAILALALVCSAVGLVVYPLAIREIGPMRTTITAYLNPAVAIAAGALVLGERITIWTIAGFALVLVGSWLVSRRPADGDASPVDPAGAAR